MRGIFEQLDQLGVSQPAGFDGHASIHQLRKVKPQLAKALGTRLKLIDDIEDSCAFAELASREKCGVGQIALARIGFTFSRFGGLVLVWSDLLVPDDFDRCFSLCEPILREAGFDAVRPGDVATAYSGQHRVWKGQSWRDRFFGEP
jgi:hypothetical protein